MMRRLISMRLQFVKESLKESIEKLEISVTSRAINGKEFFTITNWSQILVTLDGLDKFPFLTQYINNIYNLGAQYCSISKLTLETGDLNRLKGELQKLLAILKACLELLDEHVKDDDINQINVLLPSNLSLDEYEKILADLNFVFNQSYINELNEKDPVTIRDVESGSIWLILVIGGLAISLFGKLVNIAVQVYQYHKYNKGIEETIRSLKIQNDADNEVLKALKCTIDKYCSDLTQSFADSEELKITSEQLNSLTLSIEKLSKLLGKGVNFYPSLKAPEQIKAEFPTEEVIKQITSEVPQKLLSGDVDKDS